MARKKVKKKNTLSILILILTCFLLALTVVQGTQIAELKETSIGSAISGVTTTSSAGTVQAPVSAPSMVGGC